MQICCVESEPLDLLFVSYLSDLDHIAVSGSSTWCYGGLQLEPDCPVVRLYGHIESLGGEQLDQIRHASHVLVIGDGVVPSIGQRGAISPEQSGRVGVHSACMGRTQGQHVRKLLVGEIRLGAEYCRRGKTTS